MRLTTDHTDVASFDTGDAVGRSGPGRIVAIVFSAVVVGILSWLLYLAFADSADTPQSTWRPMSDNAHNIHTVYQVVFYLAAAVFVFILFLTLLFTLMFREREGEVAKQFHGNAKLEVLLVAVPVLIVVAMMVPSFKAIAQNTADPPEGALEVIAIGHQWWFEFQYPELGITTANELHLPLDRPVSVILKSDDVIHSFWIPQLVGKVDMMPGHTNHLWFTPDTARDDPYLAQCAEFCGASHANMRFRVFVDTPQKFEQWSKATAAAAVAPSTDLAKAGEQQFTQSGCVGCHTVKGNPIALGKVGPNLTHVGSRTTIASGILPNNAGNLHKWLANPPGVKPGSKMPNLGLNDEQIQRLTAYLESLK